ncbi:unnamed protein product [Arctogadus glacialis]
MRDSMERLKRLYVYFFLIRKPFSRHSLRFYLNITQTKQATGLFSFPLFDLKNRKIQFICIFVLPFFGFKTKSEKPKNDLIVFSDFVLNRNIQRTNHARIESKTKWLLCLKLARGFFLMYSSGGREGCWESGDVCSDVMTLLTPAPWLALAGVKPTCS